jgi:hypothetical protein
MTYTDLLKNTGASTTPKALYQRAKRLAAKKGLSVSKFSARNKAEDFRGAYYCDNRFHASINALLDYLAEEK